MGLDRSKVMINIDRYGNTTAATIPLCLSEWWQAGKLRKGTDARPVQLRRGLHLGRGPAEMVHGQTGEER